MKKSVIEKLAAQTRAKAPVLATLDTKKKNSILKQMASSLRQSSKIIMAENKKDLKNAQSMGLSAAMIDRLVLNEKRIDEMAKGIEDIIKLKDPVGAVTSKWKRPNGLNISKVRIPLGVIGIIYESRPNVTVDAAVLCFKSGNAVILRGGKEAFYSNKVLGKILQKVLVKNKINPSVITVVPSTDRKVLVEMLQLAQFIDVIIPRGGEGLMKFMVEHSKIPIIKHDKGVCNYYVDKDADLKQAVSLIFNSKAHRPGVCNALENLFVHEKIANKFLPLVSDKLIEAGVELRGDAKAKSIVTKMKKATPKDWDTEYLDLILSVRVVKNDDEAIDLIRKHGSLHTEAIATKNKKTADKFVRSLDSSCIMVNASTRFNDGGQLGLGAEIGISTTKMHAFGPMGLEELTTTKYVVKGKGQVRK